MELQLSINALPLQNTHQYHPVFQAFDMENDAVYSRLAAKKRSYTHAFQAGGKSAVVVAVPLLVWSGNPNDGDGDDDDPTSNQRSFTTAFKNEVEENKGIVGWPPIKTWRRKLLDSRHVEGLRNHRHNKGGRGCGCGRRSTARLGGTIAENNTGY